MSSGGDLIKVHPREDPDWNKLPLLKVNSVSYNQDKSLIVVSTNYGYRVFDVNNNFKLLSQLDENQRNLGDLKIAKILFRSEIIGFIGTKNNPSYKENSLFIYSDRSNKILGKITLNKVIYDFHFSSSVLFVCLLSNIYVFELKNLKYIHCIKCCMAGESGKLISVIEDPLEIISGKSDKEYSNWENKITSIGFLSSYDKIQSKIFLYRYLVNKNKINYVIKDELKTSFKGCLKYFKLINDLKLIAVSHNGNKIHIYDYVNKTLESCIYLSNQKINILNASFGLKNKFIMLMADTGEINLFKFTPENKSKYICKCNEHPDGSESLLRKSTHDIYGFVEKKLSVTNEPFCWDIINDKNNKNSKIFRCEFHPTKKNYIIIINDNGNVYLYQFNRKEEENKFDLIKTIELFKQKK